MRSLIRPTYSVARNTMSRAMSSVIPGRVLTGVHWDYRIIDTVSGDNTHSSFAFKAEVIPRDDILNSPRWAFVKGASIGNSTAIDNLDRECRSYRLPGVASAACFREMYDLIDVGGSERYIAFEWLETTLAQLKYLPTLRTYIIIETFLRAALNSCVILESQRYVNTDYKPANILLSGIETGLITAKVGDLGLVFPAGCRFEAQPYAMRAPEVFLGQACTEPSQVWAVAAMVLCWIKPGVLGAWDSPHFLIDKAWSMAKMKRLFPSWNIPTPDEVEGDSFKAAVKSARRMSQEELSLRATLPLEEEMRGLEIPQQLCDLLRLMLVVDPAERPPASSILASTEFRAFHKFIGRMIRSTS